MRRPMHRPAGPLLVVLCLVPAVLFAAPKKKQPPKPPKAEQVKAAEAAKPPLQSLVSAEQGFARMALAKNTRDAFVANLAADCVMFRPLPVNGYDLYVNRQPNTARLAWAPVFAEVSAAGDLGVTTGPWEFTPPPDQANAEIAYGQFFSVWKRDAGQPWKVALDCGVSHPRPDAPGVGASAVTPGPAHTTADGDAGGLADIDARIAARAQELNGPRAVMDWTTTDLRYLREGEWPRTGQDARNAMSAMPSHVTFRTLGSGLARSSDLGYTYGVREDASDVADHAPDSTVYVHVWRRTGPAEWRISLAVEQPIRH